MASATDSAATQQQYLAQVATTAALTAAIQQLVAHAPDINSGVFKAGLQAITAQFGQAAAAIARNYYQQVRTAAGVTAPIRVAPISQPAPSLVDAAVQKAHYNAGSTLTDDALRQAVLDGIKAEIQKIVTDAARQQIVAAVAGDRFALGFRRVPRPDACAFCLLMATRTSTRTRTQGNDGGKFIHDPSADHFGVYKTRSGAGELPAGSEDTNSYHPNCHCVVEPVFFMGAPAQYLVDARDLYDRTGGGLNGFRRALNAQRQGREPQAPVAPVTPLTVSSAPDPRLTDLLGRLSDFMSNRAA